MTQSETGGHPSERVPAYVALVRIIAVIGMAMAIALGIFLLLGGWWVAGLIAFLFFGPSFFLMRLVERTVEPPGTPPTS